jgi:hypothetical protein
MRYVFWVLMTLVMVRLFVGVGDILGNQRMIYGKLLEIEARLSGHAREGV